MQHSGSFLENYRDLGERETNSTKTYSGNLNLENVHHTAVNFSRCLPTLAKTVGPLGGSPKPPCEVSEVSQGVVQGLLNGNTNRMLFDVNDEREGGRETPSV